MPDKNAKDEPMFGEDFGFLNTDWVMRWQLAYIRRVHESVVHGEGK